MRPFVDGRFFMATRHLRERENVLILIITTIIANYGTTPGLNDYNNRRK